MKHPINSRVIANCGTRREKRWRTGRVLEYNPGVGREYQIELDEECDGHKVWYVPDNYVVADTNEARRRRKMKAVEDSRKES